MEPARLRAVLARTPGLTAGHLDACLHGGHPPGDPWPTDLLARLMQTGLPRRARAWLKQPDSPRIDSDMRWMEENDCRIVTALDVGFPRRAAPLDAMPAALFLQGSSRLLCRPALAVVGAPGRHRPPGSRPPRVLRAPSPLPA